MSVVSDKLTFSLRKQHNSLTEIMGCHLLGWDPFWWETTRLDWCWPINSGSEECVGRLFAFWDCFSGKSKVPELFWPIRLIGSENLSVVWLPVIVSLFGK